MSNIFPIDFEEKLTMAQNDYILFSDSEDGNKIKKAQYKNLKGEPGTPGTPGKDGEDGAAATITVGSTTTGTPGSSASVTNSGTSSAAVLDFTIPQGAKGEPGEDGQDGADGVSATITVGTTTTLPAGSSATVTNVGTSQDAILNFGIPKGDAGTGSGDVNGPASSTDGDVALFDGATGKLIKDSGVSLADYQEKLTAGTNIQISAGNVISATGGSDIVYATQAEYNALLPGAESDGKHYFIYSTDGGGGWQPGANTILYLPLQGDILDHSGNNTAVTTDTLSSYRTFDSYGAVYSISGTVNGARTQYGNNTGTTSGTVSCVVKITEYHANGHFFTSGLVGLAQIPGMSNKFRAEFYGSSVKTVWSSLSASLDTWYHIVAVRDSGNLYLYINGNLVGTGSGMSGTTTKLFTIPGWNDVSVDWAIRGGLAEVIQEDVARSQSDITTYLNSIKDKYGIS